MVNHQKTKKCTANCSGYQSYIVEEPTESDNEKGTHVRQEELITEEEQLKRITGGIKERKEQAQKEKRKTKEMHETILDQ